MPKDFKTIRTSVPLSIQIRRIPSSKSSIKYSKNPWICQSFYPSKSKPVFILFLFIRGRGNGLIDGWMDGWMDDLRLPALFNGHNTVELQWLEHLWNHENMFETGSSS